MNTFGLIGKNISYSFSKKYFTEKFKELGLEDYQYLNFDLKTIDELPNVIAQDIIGLNVTIPYKEQVFDYLNTIDKKAESIGAVNTIKVENGYLTGFNTDSYGFEKSIKPLLKEHHNKALVLGTGGASKAVLFVLKELGIDVLVVSRNPKQGQIAYHNITKDVMLAHTIIINCTPVGTHPNIEHFPSIPYQYINDKHLLYDLIYNPAETSFLRKGKNKGATISNGLKMLELQAEKAWEIWNR